MKVYNNEYKIKVNRTILEKENINKFNNKIKKYPFKKSILNDLKCNTEIIINEFHQTSNNINTNINIKNDKGKISEIEDRNNNDICDDNIFSNYENYNKKRYSYDEGYLKRQKGNNQYSFNKTYTNLKNLKHKFNILSNENNETIEKCFPMSSRFNFYNNNTIYKEKDPNFKTIKFNKLTKQKNKISDYIIHDPLEEITISKFERPKIDRNKILNKFKIINNFFEVENNIYSNKLKNLKQRSKNLSQDEIITNKENIYHKKSNISLNFDKRLSSATIRNSKEIGNDNRMDFINKGNFCGNMMEKGEKYKSNTYDDWYNIKELNIKLMNYRIILFKQFYIHFEKYYKSFIKYHQEIFFKRIKYNCHYKYSNNTFTYHKNLKSNKYSTDYNSFSNNIRDNNSLEQYKYSTTNDYYNFNKKINLNKNIKSSLFNDIYRNVDDNFKSNKIELIKNEFKSIENNDKDTTCFSDRKHFINKNLLNSIIKSPFSIDENHTFRNTAINFRDNNNNKKEKELFRSKEELIKKEEQIKRRKKSKNDKNGHLLNNRNQKNSNQTKNSKKIKDSKEYNQFSELRVKLNKKNNNKIKKLTIGKTSGLNPKLINSKKEKETKTINIKSKDLKNGNSNFNDNNYKINNKAYLNTKKNINFYKKIKDNNNKKFLIKERYSKTIKQINKSNGDNHNYIYYNKKNNISKNKEPKLINEIITKDKRILINIFYYNYNNNYSSTKKATFMKYYPILESQNFSLSINSNINNKILNKKIRLKQILSSIKEEEASIQNSKLCDEQINSFNLDNTRNPIFHNEFVISQFINIIETVLIHIYKRIFLFRIKTINIVKKMNEILFINNKKISVSHEKNKINQIYNKKLGIKANKKTINKKNEIEIKHRKDLWSNRIKELKILLILFAVGKHK